MTTVARSGDIEHFKSLVRSREISPELVLVDPELASVARASLEPYAERAPTAAASPPAAPPEPLRAVPQYFSLPEPRFVHPSPALTDEGPLRGWEAVAATTSHLFKLLTPAILFLSFLVNLALAGALFAGGGDAPHLESASASVQSLSTRSPEPVGETPTVVQANTNPSRETGRSRAQSKRTAKANAGRARRQARARAKASAERTVLTLLQAMPKARIAALLDPSSGLLKNNVQAVCQRRPARHVASFLCVIRVAGAPHITGIYVRYSVKPGGGWSVTWLPRPKP
jgi:hypothetical protein